MLDTLRLAHDLRDAGMPAAEAEALASHLNQALSDTVATKADLLALEARISAKLYGVGLTVVVALGLVQHFFK